MKERLGEGRGLSWLCGQVRVLCITNEVIPAAEAAAQVMREAGLRVQVEHGKYPPLQAFGMHASRVSERYCA